MKGIGDQNLLHTPPQKKCLLDKELFWTDYFEKAQTKCGAAELFDVLWLVDI